MAKTKTNHDSQVACQDLQKIPKLKKEDFIRTLAKELTDTAWDMIFRIRGRAIPETQSGREKLLNTLIHKATINKHGTSRAACQDLQKDACKLYSVITGIPHGSSRDDLAEIKPRQSGQSGIDVVLGAMARDKCLSLGLPTCPECKNEKDWDLQRAIMQARANTPKGESWLLVLKRRAKLKKDRIDPVVIMDLEVFKNLILNCLGRKGL